MKLTRSVSLQAWRYGVLPACTAPELHEVGVRVDATAHAACTTPEDAATLLALLNGGLGHWLQRNWAGRLLLGTDDGPARDFLQANPSALGREPAQLPCARDEESLARYLLVEVCPKLFSAHALEVRELAVNLDPGQDARVVLRGGRASAAVCVTEQASEVTVWTRLCDKTKYGLVRRQDRPASGDAS